jgi:hypothetical protein
VAGELILVSSDGKQLSSPLGPDGGYYLPNPPPGQSKIAIKKGLGGALPPPISGKQTDVKGNTDLGAKTEKQTAGVEPPAKYASAESSGLTYEVKTGVQKKDFELTP